MQIQAARRVQHPTALIPAYMLRGWTPVEARVFGDYRRIDWARFGDIRFSDPFFYQSLVRFKSQESYEYLETGFDALEAFQTPGKGLAPNGFIFHISHCGSTLVSNVLGGSERNLSVSEPAPINSIFADAGATPEQQVRWLRGMIHAYGQRRFGEDRFFLKFNSYALGFFSLIREAFPDTPWICMYRHPVEVMSGQFRRPELNTYWLLDQRFSGLDREQRVAAPLAEVLARTLGRYYQAIRQIALDDGKGLCINYSQLGRETYRRVLEHFDAAPKADEFEGMLSATRFHSKDRQQKAEFRNDSEEKRRDAYPSVVEAAEKWAIEPYSQLEEIRLGDD